MKIVNEKIIIKKSELIINDMTSLKDLVLHKIKGNGKPVRFVIVESNDLEYICEVDVCDDDKIKDIFDFSKRSFENTDEFNIVFCVPTGIGAEVGGHCGDANAVVRLFGSICDNLITHPNCVNGANYNEQPPNTLYVEGSVLTSLFMGTLGLKKVRNNRILLLLDKHKNHYFNDEIINAASNARVLLGATCAVHLMDDFIDSKIEFTDSGRASGKIENLEFLFNEIDKFNYDAIALSTSLEAPVSYYYDYFVTNSIKQNNMEVNPWGSIEAMITHAVSNRYNIPCAHAPLISEEAYDLCPFAGIVDPRKAPESESVADIFCCLKGLQKSPKIVSAKEGLNSKDISCLVIPHGCVGLPVLAAFAQSIPVISVKENVNLMKNRFSDYDFPNKRLYEVNNYWEALAVCQAIKCGIDPDVLRRPILPTKKV